MRKKSPKKRKNPVKKEHSEVEHGRRAMISPDGMWTKWRIEFDAQDGYGQKWHCGCGTGSGNNPEETARHFRQKGYTIVEWTDDV